MFRNRTQAKRRRGLTPAAESLEDRKLLYATLGAEWANAARITYSFAPDGTDVGGTPSSWVQRMDQLGITQETWKNEFRKAAAFWQYYAGINMVEVPDDGSPLSVSGNQQGDSRFGDIRIAGIAQSPSTLGVSFLPPPYLGGTLAGDIVMNTAQTWRVGGTVDVATVALHEFGHSLGLDHCNINDAVMFSTYTGIKQYLRTDDIAGVQEVYGPRQKDFLEGTFGNDFFFRSTIITSAIDSQNQIRLGGLDIQSTSDNDWFYVVAPPTATSVMTVSMQSTGLSSLTPTVMVYDAQLRGLAIASGTTYGGTATVTIPNVQPGRAYFIRAVPGVNGPTGAGTYGLLVNMGSSPIAPIAPPNTTVPEQPDQGGGAIGLETNKGKKDKSDEGAHMVHLGTLRGLADILSFDAKDKDKKDNRLSLNLPRIRDGRDAVFATIPVTIPPASVWLDAYRFGGADAVRTLGRTLIPAIDTLLDRWCDD